MNAIFQNSKFILQCRILENNIFSISLFQIFHIKCNLKVKISLRNNNSKLSRQYWFVTTLIVSKLFWIFRLIEHEQKKVEIKTLRRIFSNIFVIFLFQVHVLDGWSNQPLLFVDQYF
jgi:hypothetical protein